MQFNEIIDGLVKNAERYGQKHNIEFTPDFCLLKLVEELGECTQAFLIHKKQCRETKFVSEEESKKELAKELADVVGMAIINAHVHGIDIEEALTKKWITREWVK